MGSESRKLKKQLYRQTPKGKYETYKSNASKYRREFTLTFEQFMIFWQKQCYYCNCKIDTIGIDRLDSTKGYTLENIVPCCAEHNRMKLNFSLDEFILNCKKVIEHQQKNKVNV